jgi:hypothetical protein
MVLVLGEQAHERAFPAPSPAPNNLHNSAITRAFSDFIHEGACPSLAGCPLATRCASFLKQFYSFDFRPGLPAACSAAAFTQALFNRACGDICLGHSLRCLKNFRCAVAQCLVKILMFSLCFSCGRHATLLPPPFSSPPAPLKKQLVATANTLRIVRSRAHWHVAVTRRRRSICGTAANAFAKLRRNKFVY